MTKKITIKDIAREAGVSLGSVHLALNGKPGISEQTRAKIRRIAEELDYRPNMLASNLKRETRTIAVALPKKDSRSRFYYDYMWNALADFEPVAKDYNLNLKKLEYSNLAESLNKLDLSLISGLITVGYPEEEYGDAIKRVASEDIPVLLIDSDLPESGRICCVRPDTRIVGRLTGELLVDVIHRIDGKILVCAGNAAYPNHSQIVDALSECLEERGVMNRLIIEYFDDVGDESQSRIEEVLMNNRIIGCCSVNSRSTLVLAEAVIHSGLSGEVPVIGSGLFEESAGYLREGVITMLIHKKPYEQCYRALEMMADLLAKNIQINREYVNVGVDAVFKSNLTQYDEVSFRMGL